MPSGLPLQMHGVVLHAKSAYRLARLGLGVLYACSAMHNWRSTHITLCFTLAECDNSWCAEQGVGVAVKN